MNVRRRQSLDHSGSPVHEGPERRDARADGLNGATNRWDEGVEKGSIVDRYIERECGIHLHFRVRWNDGERDRCAVFQLAEKGSELKGSELYRGSDRVRVVSGGNRDEATTIIASVESDLRLWRGGVQQVQLAMPVDPRKIMKKGESLADLRSLVWLQALDLCPHLLRNAGQDTIRVRLPILRLGQDWEGGVTRSAGSCYEDDHVVEGRAGVLKEVPKDQADAIGWLLNDLDAVLGSFAAHISGSEYRCSVVEGAQFALDGFEVFIGATQLQIKTVDHGA